MRIEVTMILEVKEGAAESVAVPQEKGEDWQLDDPVFCKRTGDSYNNFAEFIDHQFSRDLQCFSVVEAWGHKLASETQGICLNSINHYQVLDLGEAFLLIEYGSACSKMGQGPPYKTKEGAPIAILDKNETYKFVDQAGNTYTACMTGISDSVHCGDDFLQTLMCQK